MELPLLHPARQGSACRLRERKPSYQRHGRDQQKAWTGASESLRARKVSVSGRCFVLRVGGVAALAGGTNVTQAVWSLFPNLQRSQELLPWLMVLAGDSAWKGNIIWLFSDYMQFLDALVHLGMKAVGH